jgi:AcrR family transcriptional regulator
MRAWCVDGAAGAGRVLGYGGGMTVDPGVGAGGAEGASTRERLLDGAYHLVTTQGWSSITMGRVATVVGVSRQTVYNELGTKDGLAEALVVRETDRFLALVAEALRLHGVDVVAGITAATVVALEHAETNELIHAIVGAGNSADGGGLLPLLTSRPEPVLERAVRMLSGFADEVWADIGLDQQERHDLVDTVVRLVLSHLVQPRWTPQHSAAVIGGVVRGIVAQA